MYKFTETIKDSRKNYEIFLSKVVDLTHSWKIFYNLNQTSVSPDLITACFNTLNLKTQLTELGFNAVDDLNDDDILVMINNDLAILSEVVRNYNKKD